MKRQCYFKKNDIKYIDYKDVTLIEKFLTPSAKIIGRKRSGVSAKKQRELSLSVKRARFMGLIPYVRS